MKRQTQTVSEPAVNDEDDDDDDLVTMREMPSRMKYSSSGGSEGGGAFVSTHDVVYTILKPFPPLMFLPFPIPPFCPFSSLHGKTPYLWLVKRSSTYVMLSLVHCYH